MAETAAESKKTEASEKTTPEPVKLTPERAISEAPIRFGVEPFVVEGALAGKVTGDTVTVDRVQKLVDEFGKRKVSMEPQEDDE